MASQEREEAAVAPDDAAVAVRQYAGEEELLDIMGLVDTDLSEPYSIFTYRYFLHGWPQLAFVATAARSRDSGEGPFCGKACRRHLAGSSSNSDGIDSNGIRSSSIIEVVCRCSLESVTIGTVICKAEREDGRLCGYIAMLAVDKRYRKHGLGTTLSVRAISAMREMGCSEVVLETEVTNVAALRLYEKMGFLREDRLMRYYLNGVDAFRLKLWL